MTQSFCSLNLFFSTTKPKTTESTWLDPDYISYKVMSSYLLSHILVVLEWMCPITPFSSTSDLSCDHAGEVVPGEVQLLLSKRVLFHWNKSEECLKQE